jgi:hypothetical protein
VCGNGGVAVAEVLLPSPYRIAALLSPVARPMVQHMNRYLSAMIGLVAGLIIGLVFEMDAGHRVLGPWAVIGAIVGALIGGFGYRRAS